MAGSADAPIFVAGFQRSGTTLLQALLGAHPRIAAPPETYFVYRIYQLKDYWGDLRDDGNLHRVIDEMLNPAVPLFVDCGFDAERVFRAVADGDRSYRSLFDAMMRDFADRQDKARWSDKTPGQPPAAAWELFPEAQVVHIVRDGREVVASSAAAPWEHDPPAHLARRYRQFTLDAATAGAARGPGQYLRVRYEDLCAEPAAVLRVVCAFLGEQYDDGMLTDPGRRRATVATAAAPWQQRALGEITRPAEGGWRTRLGPLDQARVSALLAPVLAPYGYPPSPPGSQRMGAVINTLTGPGRRAHRVWLRARAARVQRTPEEEYQATRRFQEERASRVR